MSEFTLGERTTVIAFDHNFTYDYMNILMLQIQSE